MAEDIEKDIIEIYLLEEKLNEVLKKLLEVMKNVKEK